MPNTNDNVKKGTKDFTEEEKAAIIARLQRIEPVRVAKEFNTTWQVVIAIRNAAKKQAAKAKDIKKAETSGSKIKKQKTKLTAEKEEKKKSASRKTSTRTSDERDAILARAEEIGVTQAAMEAGISKWTVFQWRKAIKKAGGTPAALEKKKASKTSTGKNTARAIEPVTVDKDKKEPAKNEAQKISPKKSAPANSLEFENAILKEKVAVLTEQVEKLRAAITKLA